MASGASRIEIRVVPRASRNGVDGMRDGRIVVRVTAPPVDGAATAAAVAVLADALGVARTTIHVVSGRASRNKTLTIDGLERTDVLSRMAIELDRVTGSSGRHRRDRRATGLDRQRNR